MGQWEQQEFNYNPPTYTTSSSAYSNIILQEYSTSYRPHQLSEKLKLTKDEFFSKVSAKPDPSTVEATLQEEERLWEQ